MGKTNNFTQEDIEILERASLTLGRVQESELGKKREEHGCWCGILINPTTKEHDPSYSPKGELNRDYIISSEYCDQHLAELQAETRNFSINRCKILAYA